MWRMAEERKGCGKDAAVGEVKVEIENGCFVCHGTGHWARECTSLPLIYLTDDAPKCYRCGGIGHFARFCPTSEKQFRNREKKSYLPASFFSDWASHGYFEDILISPQFTSEEIFLVRPNYFPSTNPGVHNEEDSRSDCSSVEYIVEPEAEERDVYKTVERDDFLVEISVEPQ